MTNDEQRERDMRKAMEHMASRKLTYWGFVYNFRQWKWGKSGHLAVGLLITAAFVAWGIAAPLWWNLIGWAMLGAVHWGHYENFNGRQA